MPIGLVLGTLASWTICAALRYGIGGEFAATPVWQLSPAGLCAGAVVGVVTVLLAAQAPAKRAAKVSPMAAVSGSTQNVPVGRAAHAGKGRVELALGVRHATASKKNWALMTASFALSIVLALGLPCSCSSPLCCCPVWHRGRPMCFTTATAMRRCCPAA